MNYLETLKRRVQGSSPFALTIFPNKINALIWSCLSTQLPAA